VHIYIQQNNDRAASTKSVNVSAAFNHMHTSLFD